MFVKSVIIGQLKPIKCSVLPCCWVINNVGGGEFQATVSFIQTLMPPKKRLRLEMGQKTLFSALSDKGKKGASDEVNTETGESTTSPPPSLDPVSDPTPEITNQSPGPSNDPPPGPSKPSSNRKVQVKWKKLWPWVTLKDGKMHFTLCTEKGKNNTSIPRSVFYWNVPWKSLNVPLQQKMSHWYRKLWGHWPINPFVLPNHWKLMQIKLFTA